MKRGYIKIWRKIEDDFLWEPHRPRTKFEAWYDLFSQAKGRPGKELIGSSMIPLERGQLIFSRSGLAKRWKWSRGKVGRFLDLIEQEGRICVNHGCSTDDSKTDTQANTPYSILTITKYEAYNPLPKKTATKTGSKRTANGQQTDTSNKESTLPSKSGEEKPPEWAIDVAEEFKGQLEGNGNLPTRLPKDYIEQWAWILEKCHRLDKRPIDEIRAVALYPQQDPGGFWQKNFRSLRKLRDRSRSDPDLTYYDNLLSGCREYGLLEEEEWEELQDGEGFSPS
ncbi:hypothetical protein MYX64_07485 [Nitrospinae bacterium AH_259_B05_G02_I21]|nr:hypothetical protein [Nitrospinae bacterium AH_259_B05_G02_I21]MDA2932438.1 hypothetical protein [Nitrospinae bacterium AH-259-F20]